MTNQKTIFPHTTTKQQILPPFFSYLQLPLTFSTQFVHHQIPSKFYKIYKLGQAQLIRIFLIVIYRVLKVKNSARRKV